MCAGPPSRESWEVALKIAAWGRSTEVKQKKVYFKSPILSILPWKDFEPR